MDEMKTKPHKIYDAFLFLVEINLFFFSGYALAEREMIMSIILMLSAIVVALFLGNRIYKEGKQNAIR